MINYQAEVNYMQRQLTSIASSSANIAEYTPHISDSLNNMNNNFRELGATLNSGMDNLGEGLENVSYQIGELIDVVKEQGDRQFVQNEERNNLLASIDSTLRAPNKTAAQEKFEIGVELAERGKMDFAIKMLKETIELNPLHYRAYIQLVTFYMLQKDYEVALQLALESISLAPDNQNEILAHHHYLVARAYDKINQYEKAVEYIEKAIRYRNKGEYEYERATYYAKLNEPQQAMIALREAIVLDYRFFAQSIIDPTFHRFHKEREELLEEMLRIQRGEVNRILEELGRIHYPEYAFSQNDALQLDSMNLPTNYFYYGGRYHAKHALSYLAIPGIYASEDDPLFNDNQIPYSYNKFITAFQKYYQDLKVFCNNIMQQISELENQQSFASYCEATTQGYNLVREFNQFVSSINSFLERFFNHESLFKEYIENEMSATEEEIRKQKEELKDRKQSSGLSSLIFREEREFIKSAKESIKDRYDDIEKIKRARVDVEKEIEGINRVKEVFAEQPLPRVEL